MADPVVAFIKHMPKCEHHLHIEGTLSPSLLFSLAQAKGVELPRDDLAFSSADALEERYRQFTSLDDFLHYYYIGMSALQTAYDFERLAKEYFVRAHAEGVMHAEVFFDPQAHLSRGIAYSALLNGLTQARAWAESSLGMTTQLICCFLRHLPVAETVQTWSDAELQASLSSGAVAAIGLDSSEVGFPPALFKDVYDAAETQGHKRTAHAGEEGPASNIADALDLLHVQRIDHGIRLADDEALMRRVAEQKIMLTVCPLSNVALRVVKEVHELPIRKFLDAGVAFSINSDDPAYFGGHYILDNYLAVQDAFKLTIDEWKVIGRASIEGSWCSASRKAQLHTLLEACT